MYRIDYVPCALPEKKLVPTLGDAQELEGRRIDTGIHGLNRVLGTNRSDDRTGLHVPSTVMLGGGQGSGKTTLILKMLAHIKNALLLSSEQRLSEIKSSLVGVGLGWAAERIQAYSLLDDDCSIQVALETIKKVNPRVLVIDSINELRDPTARKNSDPLALRVRIIRQLKEDSEKNDRATIMTAHFTKTDEIAGRREQLHVVSTVMLLTRIDHRLRLLCCPEKNRFGDIAERAYFEMSRKGLFEVSPPEGQPDKEEEPVTVSEDQIRQDWGLPPKGKFTLTEPTDPETGSF